MSSATVSPLAAGAEDEVPRAAPEPEQGGRSGEGAASALAQMKKQARQQLRQAGEHPGESGKETP